MNEWERITLATSSRSVRACARGSFFAGGARLAIHRQGKSERRKAKTRVSVTWRGSALLSLSYELLDFTDSSLPCWRIIRRCRLSPGASCRRRQPAWQAAHQRGIEPVAHTTDRDPVSLRHDLNQCVGL